MSVYRYDAVSRDGVSVKGVIEARDENDAFNQLKAEMSVVKSVTKTFDANSMLSSLTLPQGKIKPKALYILCQQFSIMMNAGINIGYAVHLVEHQATDKSLKKLLQQVAADVDAGNRVADSFQLHGGDRLPTTFIETIRAGEESGRLGPAFERLSSFYLTRHKLYSKIKGAMMYPIFVILLAIVVVAVVLIFAIPSIAGTFAQQGNELPAITQLLIDMSDFMRHWFWLIALIAFVIFLGFSAYAKTERGGMNFARLMFKIPMIGRIETLSIASQFAATMATMLMAGLPLLRVLEITGNTLTNKYVGHSMQNAVKGLESGFTLADCLRKENTLDDLLIEMCAMGEQSGSLEDTLRSIGNYYDYETETAAAAALAKLEPAILVFLGGFVGFIVIAIYMPMFTMYNGM